MKIALVSCVSKKSARPRPAREMYLSPWFEKAAAYAEREADRWYILSAEYGLVAPDHVIAPYEKSLNAMSVAQRRCWARGGVSISAIRRHRACITV